jgi:hypothetical protein
MNNLFPKGADGTARHFWGSELLLLAGGVRPAPACWHGAKFLFSPVPRKFPSVILRRTVGSIPLNPLCYWPAKPAWIPSGTQIVL